MVVGGVCQRGIRRGSDGSLAGSADRVVESGGGSTGRGKAVAGPLPRECGAVGAGASRVPGCKVKRGRVCAGLDSNSSSRRGGGQWDKRQVRPDGAVVAHRVKTHCASVFRSATVLRCEVRLVVLLTSGDFEQRWLRKKSGSDQLYV